MVDSAVRKHLLGATVLRHQTKFGRIKVEQTRVSNESNLGSLSSINDVRVLGKPLTNLTSRNEYETIDTFQRDG